MSTSGQAIGNLLDTLIKVGERDHGILVRLSVAVWGSLVMHLSMLARNIGAINETPDIPTEILVAIMFVGLAYCVAFGLVVAVGIVKGSLVRHFCFGAILPAFAYSLARLATL